jgi:hypothetical protein
MTKKSLLASAMTCLALVMRPSAVIAEIAEPLGNRSDAPVSGWDELIEALRALPRLPVSRVSAGNEMPVGEIDPKPDIWLGIGSRGTARPVADTIAASGTRYASK